LRSFISQAEQSQEKRSSKPKVIAVYVAYRLARESILNFSVVRHSDGPGIKYGVTARLLALEA
jgi:hypothetical protein